MVGDPRERQKTLSSRLSNMLQLSKTLGWISRHGIITLRF
jgi:hypothetical protein